MSKKRPTELDGIFGSQLRDTQGETLSVEGADISELERGAGRFNDNHAKGFTNTVGRVTYAKKIFKREDCEDDRQRYYWDKVKAPYIYGRGYLFDDEDHNNAKACAAILRNIHKTDSPLKLKLSVEGGVISRGVKDPSLLARTKIVACAITFTPANQATLVEPINLDKTSYSEEADLELIKSVMHLAETNVPSFRHITRHASAGRILNNIQSIKDMASKLGIPESDLGIPSREDLIKNAIENKVHENIKKINEMVRKLSKAEDLYHIHKDGYQITDQPVTIEHVNNMYGGVKKLENSGHILVPIKKPLKKALMAGYGGSGASTSMTGGAVIQAESLESGRGFRYISCNDCGTEQVYHRHQVRCRACNKNFSLEQLYGLIASK